jgi:hypothetical protein
LFENISNSAIIYSNTDSCKLNYPKIWVLISSILKINQDTFLYSYISILTIFYIFIFYKFTKKYSSYFFIYLFFSGSSLLVLERGNIDMMIFILLYYSITSKNLIIKHLLFVSSVILKIFPIFGILGLLKKNNYYFIIFTTIICLIYFSIFANDLLMIKANTPQTGDMTYGTLSVIKNLSKHFNIFFKHYYLSFILCIFCFFLYSFMNKEILEVQNNNDEKKFFLGSGIFIFSFLVSSSHDYRLIFICFIIPTILKLKNKFFKNFFLLSVILSLELHRLIFLLGFAGGIINTAAKTTLFILCSLIYLNLMKKHIKIILKIN